MERDRTKDAEKQDQRCREAKPKVQRSRTKNAERQDQRLCREAGDSK